MGLIGFWLRKFAAGVLVASWGVTVVAAGPDVPAAPLAPAPATAEDAARSEKAASEKLRAEEDAKLAAVPKIIDRCQMAALGLADKAKALAPDALKIESNPEFQAMCLEWEKGIARVDAMVREEKPWDDVEKAEKGLADLRQRWEARRADSSKAFDEAIDAMMANAEMLYKAKIDLAYTLAERKARVELDQIRNDFRAVASVQEPRLQNAAAGQDKLERESFEKMEKAAQAFNELANQQTVRIATAQNAMMEKMEKARFELDKANLEAEAKVRQAAERAAAAVRGNDPGRADAVKAADEARATFDWERRAMLEKGAAETARDGAAFNALEADARDQIKKAEQRRAETDAQEEKVRNAARAEHEKVVADAQGLLQAAERDAHGRRTNAEKEKRASTVLAMRAAAAERDKMADLRAGLIPAQARREDLDGAHGSLFIDSAPIYAQLQRVKMPEIKFNAVAADDAIDFFRDVTGQAIVVDWRALEAAGIAKDAPIDYTKTDVPGWEAMTTAIGGLKDRTGGKPVAVWGQGKFVYISTAGGVAAMEKAFKRLSAARPAEAMGQAMLDRRLPEVNFNANALSDILDFMKDVTGTKFDTDWKAMEAGGLTKDSPVTLRMRNVRTGEALLLTLIVSGAGPEIGFSFKDGTFHVGAWPK